MKGTIGSSGPAAPFRLTIDPGNSPVTLRACLKRLAGLVGQASSPWHRLTVVGLESPGQTGQRHCPTFQTGSTGFVEAPAPPEPVVVPRSPTSAPGPAGTCAHGRVRHVPPDQAGRRPGKDTIKSIPIRRARAEAELELTNEGLQRAARFSSDASHQLKSPVTVLRAGRDRLAAYHGRRVRADGSGSTAWRAVSCPYVRPETWPFINILSRNDRFSEAPSAFDPPQWMALRCPALRRDQAEHPPMHPDPTLDPRPDPPEPPGAIAKDCIIYSVHTIFYMVFLADGRLPSR